MAGPKIVVIGAASASFGMGMLRDLMTTEALRGSSVVLVDLNKEALAPMAALARRMNREWGCGMTIRRTTDRRRALDGADFVIVSIEVDRERRWRTDWEIPLKYGIRQPLGENGGPGGLSHALRTIPPVVAIARDMERLCPHAWLLNFTNPMARVCQAVTRCTSIHTVGLCHGLAGLLRWVAGVMGVPEDALYAKAAGLITTSLGSSICACALRVRTPIPCSADASSALTPTTTPSRVRSSMSLGCFHHAVTTTSPNTSRTATSISTETGSAITSASTTGTPRRRGAQTRGGASAA